MRSATAFVLFLGAALGLTAQQASVDPAKLETVRKMSPEERAKLKARLDELKKLTPVERERLSENLRKIKAMPAEEVQKVAESSAKLTDADRKELSALGAGFFRWIHHDQCLAEPRCRNSGLGFRARSA